MKKKTRRSEAKFPALDPKLNLKARQPYLDFDYINQLSDNEKQWLNDFSNEYYNADFKTNVEQGRKRIHKKKKVEQEKNKFLRKLLTDSLPIIKSLIAIIEDSPLSVVTKSSFKKSVNSFKKQFKKQIQKEFGFIEDFHKKECEKNNNSRNTCDLTRANSQGKLKSLDYVSETFLVKTNTEDELINKIDSEKEEN